MRRSKVADSSLSCWLQEINKHTNERSWEPWAVENHLLLAVSNWANELRTGSLVADCIVAGAMLSSCCFANIELLRDRNRFGLAWYFGTTNGFSFSGNCGRVALSGKLFDRYISFAADNWALSSVLAFAVVCDGDSWVYPKDQQNFWFLYFVLTTGIVMNQQLTRIRCGIHFHWLLWWIWLVRNARMIWAHCFVQFGRFHLMILWLVVRQ